MNRYLFRVQYTLTDHVTYERHCIRAETEAAARAEVDEATQRYTTAVGATKSIALLDVVAG
jgi:hypothetical protein